MTGNKRIGAFSTLGRYLIQNDNEIRDVKEQATYQNPWFTPSNIDIAIQAIAKNLNETDLSEWLSAYNIEINTNQTKVVGLILAGNIPLVGFQDILCCLLSGLSIQVKLSSDDTVLIPFLLNKLQEIEPSFKSKIQYTDRLNNFDIIIATGSNNTSRYFDYYFKNVPHIIRRNRNGIAILAGNENQSELKALGHDIFDYFGLGCRNVSKIYFPKGYHFPKFFEAIEQFSEIGNHYKYHNNYDYNKSIYLVNGNKHLDNGFLLVKEDVRIASPLAVVFYEEYEGLAQLENSLLDKKNEIQCIVSNINLPNTSVFPLGQSQQPALTDYADGIDVMKFLTEIH